MRLVHQSGYVVEQKEGENYRMPYAFSEAKTVKS